MPVSGPIVIFGDKLHYGPLLDRLLTLLRPGGVLITDNVLWDCEVVPALVTRPWRLPAATAGLRLVTSFLPIRDGLARSVKRR